MLIVLAGPSVLDLMLEGGGMDTTFVHILYHRNRIGSTAFKIQIRGNFVYELHTKAHLHLPTQYT